MAEQNNQTNTSEGFPREFINGMETQIPGGNGVVYGSRITKVMEQEHPIPKKETEESKKGEFELHGRKFSYNAEIYGIEYGINGNLQGVVRVSFEETDGKGLNQAYSTPGRRLITSEGRVSTRTLDDMFTGRPEHRGYFDAAIRPLVEDVQKRHMEEKFPIMQKMLYEMMGK